MSVIFSQPERFTEPTCERSDVFAGWHVVHADVVLPTLSTEHVLVADGRTDRLDVVADSDGRD